MNIINISDYIAKKICSQINKVEKYKINKRAAFYQIKFGGGIPDFVSFDGFIDSFAIFNTSNCDTILIDKKDLHKFLVSQKRLNQNVKPIYEAMNACVRDN
jgi:hypothetical protein